MGNDEAVTAILAGVFGYIAGKEKNASFDPIIKKYFQRLEQLRFFKIYPQMGFFNKNPNMTVIFRESILCYLFGLTNSCVPNIVRVLENALRQKYAIVEQKDSLKIDLHDLINWGEKSLNINSTTAHSYRMLRNLIHSDQLIGEQDCLEAIRHVTNIISYIFPEYGEFQISCPYCYAPKNKNIEFIDEAKFLGNVLEIACSCRKKYSWLVFP